MKNKILFVFVITGIIYLVYFVLDNYLIKHPPKPFLFRQAYLDYGAKWFHSKSVNKIVSTEPIGKHKNIFENYDIDVFREEFDSNPQSDDPGENQMPSGPPPANSELLNLNIFFNFAKKSNSKGIYIQGNFEANDKNIELMQNFINTKGFIYFNSPSDFMKMSESFIEFIRKNTKAGSIAVMHFTQTSHKPGSSIMDNLDYLIQYDSSSVDSLITLLKEQFELQKKSREEFQNQ